MVIMNTKGGVGKLRKLCGMVPEVGEQFPWVSNNHCRARVLKGYDIHDSRCDVSFCYNMNLEGKKRLI